MGCFRDFGLVKGRDGGKQAHKTMAFTMFYDMHRRVGFVHSCFVSFMLLLVAVVSGSSVMTTHRSHKPCDSASCYKTSNVLAQPLCRGAKTLKIPVFWAWIE